MLLPKQPKGTPRSPLGLSSTVTMQTLANFSIARYPITTYLIKQTHGSRESENQKSSHAYIQSPLKTPNASLFAFFFSVHQELRVSNPSEHLKESGTAHFKQQPSGETFCSATPSSKIACEKRPCNKCHHSSDKHSGKYVLSAFQMPNT